MRVKTKPKGNKSMTIKDAANLMGCSPQFLRMGLRQNKFSFGTAVKMERQWRYYINDGRFNTYMLGIA